MDKLPKGWNKIRFGDITINFDGKRIPVNSIDRTNKKGIYPYYGASGIIDYVEDFIFDGEYLLVSEDGANLLARTYPIAFIAKGKFWVNNHAHIVQARIEYTQNKFLEYFFASYNVSEYVTGSAQPKLNQKNLNEIKIPLPSLPEQTRIVSTLDALFARIDKSIALLEENIKHTKGLMASVLEEVFRDAEKNWKFKKLKFVTTKIGSGSTPRGGNDSYKASGISLIRSMNVYDGEFRSTGLAFIDDIQAQKLANVAINKDDVLLNITGASVARCAIVDESILPARVNQHVSIIRPTSELNPNFLQAYLTSPVTKSKLLFNSGGGATREAITKSMIENLEVPIPEGKVQERIINYIQKVTEVNSKIIIEQQSKLTCLKALKSSLLDRAFKGDL